MTTPRNLLFTLCLILSSALLCNAQEQNTQNQPAAAAPTEPSAATTGSGTPGKISKFTAATVLGNSVMTENAKKIGVNVSPTATLHVHGPQPPTQAAISGTGAPALLSTTGGKGGNTNGAGKTGGKGASIVLAAGQGGDAPAGGINGTGGSITLQPGSAGTGGAGGAAGNVLMATQDGAVGIGTATPNTESKLHVLSSTTDIDGVVLGENKNSLGEFNVGVRGLSHYGTGLWGNGGTVGAQAYGGSIGVIGVSTSGNGNGVRGSSSKSDGVYGETNGTSVSGVLGKNNGTGGVGVSGIAGGGKGVYGQSNTSSGVFGFSGSGDGVTGQSSTGYAGNFLGKAKVTGNFEVGGSESFGAATRQMINLYNTTYGIGVQPYTFYFRTDNSFNWYLKGVHVNTANSAGAGGTTLMELNAVGNLFVKGGVLASSYVQHSDRNLKANFSAVNPRAVLDKLAAIPLQTWNYKSEPETVRHMGPMAQDFRAAFQLGADDKGINTVDAAGVTMAAVQGLYQLSLEKDKKIEQLTAEVDELKARLRRLEEAVTGRQK